LRLSRKFAIALASALSFAGLCFGQPAKPREPGITGPSAVATKADVSYCFARTKGIDPARLPPPYLVLQARVRVSYRNAGTRPLILPLERGRTVYSGLKREDMSVIQEELGLFDTALKVMKALPSDVSPDSPISPKNDVFTVIPAGGEMTPTLMAEISLPVSRKSLFKRSPDLRGHRVYIKLQFVHRELSDDLKADLSDRWSRFGVPWTGTLTTNTIVVDVPAKPQPAACLETQALAQPVAGPDSGTVGNED
jgi:hypothetical protein